VGIKTIHYEQMLKVHIIIEHFKEREVIFMKEFIHSFIVAHTETKRNPKKRNGKNTENQGKRQLKSKNITLLAK
jgi:Na+(H+)/acetate symporter ActP